MYIGFAKFDKNNAKNYSNMYKEEKFSLKKKIIQDALSFSQNYSYLNFVDYQYLYGMYTYM
ncbi:conserved protein, unknown function, partial [Hepatocystis sp. ex Piliocolobus tephrosceles]